MTEELDPAVKRQLPYYLALSSWRGRARLALQIAAMILVVALARVLLDRDGPSWEELARRLPLMAGMALGTGVLAIALASLVAHVGGKLVMRFDPKARERAERLEAQLRADGRLPPP